MNSVRYIGMDVHRDTISVAVLDGEGRLLMQSVMATRAAAILDFVAGLRGTLQVTLEEGTHSAWLHDLLVGWVAKLVVCNPRKNALLKSGSKSDANRLHRQEAVWKAASRGVSGTVGQGAGYGGRRSVCTRSWMPCKDCAGRCAIK